MAPFLSTSVETGNGENSIFPFTQEVSGEAGKSVKEGRMWRREYYYVIQVPAKRDCVYIIPADVRTL